MKNINKLFMTLLCASTMSVANADELFVQDGFNYVVKSGVVGVIRKPSNDYSMTPKQLSAAKKQKTFFDIYDDVSLKGHSVKLSNSQKYRVVYRQVRNSKTNKVTDIPGLLTGQLIVQAKDISSVKTSLKLKKSFQENGFYIYELSDNQSVSTALSELTQQPGVKNARVEVIENLRVPM